MKKVLFLSVLILTGCVAPQTYYQLSDPVAARCEYEAEMAIQSIANPLYAGYRKAELITMCMRAQGR